MSVLEVQNLTYVYSPRTPYEKTALNDVSFAVEAGDLLGIIGHTGSGKSTLVQHLNGLLRPASGRVLLDGRGLPAAGALGTGNGAGLTNSAGSCAAGAVSAGNGAFNAVSCAGSAGSAVSCAGSCAAGAKSPVSAGRGASGAFCTQGAGCCG